MNLIEILILLVALATLAMTAVIYKQMGGKIEDIKDMLHGNKKST